MLVNCIICGICGNTFRKPEFSQELCFDHTGVSEFDDLLSRLIEHRTYFHLEVSWELILFQGLKNGERVWCQHTPLANASFQSRTKHSHQDA